jgi:predicted acylesterase/phospholipase RssA
MSNLRLIFTGSGTLYPTYAGAVLCLVKAGYNISSVYGVSSGSMIAAALSTGYAPNNELVKLIKQMLPSKYNYFNKSTWSLISKKGLIKTDKINKLNEKYFINNFKDAKIPVGIVANDISNKSHIVFDKHSEPQIPLPLALTAGSAIPTLYQPTKINGKYYTSSTALPTTILDTSEETIIFRAKSTVRQSIDVKSLKDFLFSNVMSNVEVDNNKHISNKLFAKTIMITSDLPSLSMDLTDRDVDKMIAEGYGAAERWIRS